MIGLQRIVRNVVVLVLVTFFSLYAFLGMPTYKMTVPNVTIDLNDIISSLYEQNQTCSRPFQNYLDGEKSAGDSVVADFYQPPCPLADMPDFYYLINRDICGHDNVYILVLVGSNPRHIKLREVIRKTWGNPQIKKYPFKLLFTFGKLLDPKDQRQIEEENRKFGDIIQGSFIDHYHNVTLRDLMALRWSWQYCSQAKFVMRADDDVSIDIFGLITRLEELFGDYPNDFVACFQKMVDTPVLRVGRYAVSKADHPSDVYETYCQGWMYILTPRMAFQLDLASSKVKPYWMNDAYITGTLVSALGQTPRDLAVKYTVEVTDMETVRNRLATLEPKYVIGPTGANPTLTYLLHQNYKYYALLKGLLKRNGTNYLNRTVWKNTKLDSSWVAYRNNPLMMLPLTVPSETTKTSS